MGMSMNQSSGRVGGHRRSIRKPFSEMNVTPFVDVMLVLLVVFMVTTPLLTVNIPVDLPKTKGVKMKESTEPLVVTVNATGNIYLQETELDGDALIARLMAISGNNPDTKIYVRGDQSIHYGRVIEVMGMISAAGFTKVALVAQLQSGPSKTNPMMPHQPMVSARPLVQTHKTMQPHQGMVNQGQSNAVGGMKPVSMTKGKQSVPPVASSSALTKPIPKAMSLPKPQRSQ